MRVAQLELGRAGVAVHSVSANDLASENAIAAHECADLLIVEDVQHLPLRFVDALIAVIDYRLPRDLPVIITATQGPGQLTHRGRRLPRRLTNRFAAGLVVQIEPMRPASRRRFLEAQLAEAGLNLDAKTIAWLAEHLIGGGRQLQGAVAQLKSLQRGQRKPLSLEAVQRVFERTAEPVRRIVECVADCYDVRPQHVLSSRRSHDVLVPRQVSMYLARQLTPLSLAQIGEYFGGRDHTTVQHACAKIEAAMKKSPALLSTVRDLQAQLH
jgi:chromosomal replication initiator protein